MWILREKNKEENSYSPLRWVNYDLSGCVLSKTVILHWFPQVIHNSSLHVILASGSISASCWSHFIPQNLAPKLFLYWMLFCYFWLEMSRKCFLTTCCCEITSYWRLDNCWEQCFLNRKYTLPKGIFEAYRIQHTGLKTPDLLFYMPIMWNSFSSLYLGLYNFRDPQPWQVLMKLWCSSESKGFDW